MSNPLFAGIVQLPDWLCPLFVAAAIMHLIVLAFLNRRYAKWWYRKYGGKDGRTRPPT